MFNWQKASLDECAWHVARESAQLTNAQLTYYKKHENFDVVEKILAARKLAKKYIILIRAEEISRQLDEKDRDSFYSKEHSIYAG